MTSRKAGAWQWFWTIPTQTTCELGVRFALRPGKKRQKLRQIRSETQRACGLPVRAIGGKPDVNARALPKASAAANPRRKSLNEWAPGAIAAKTGFLPCACSRHDWVAGLRGQRGAARSMVTQSHVASEARRRWASPGLPSSSNGHAGELNPAPRRDVTIEIARPMGKKSTIVQRNRRRRIPGVVSAEKNAHSTRFAESLQSRRFGAERVRASTVHCTLVRCSHSWRRAALGYAHRF